jgi:hypothetical protein
VKSPDDPFGNLVSRAGIVRVRNALNPLLWATATMFPAGVGAAYLFRDDAALKYALLAFGASPGVLMLAAYIFYMFRDPDRLQSEEFVLRQRELIIYEKGADAARIDPSRDTLRIEQHPGGFGHGESQ